MPDTLACLRSLAAVDYPRLQVVLVGNGSRDLDPEAARAAFPGLDLVTSPQNLGFAGGTNLGLERALAAGADLILLLNNDTVVEPDLIRALLPPLADPQVGIVGPTVTYFDAPDRVWFAGGTYSRLIGYTFHPGMDGPVRPPPAGDPAPSRRVDFITGCALLARREVFERIGLLWEGAFLYFEDAEFCLRAGQAGWRCVLVDRPLVRHKVSASAGRRGTNRLTPDRAYYFGRNPLLMARRLAPARPLGWLPGGGLGFLAVIAPINSLRLLAARDPRALLAYLRGIADGLRNRPGPRPAEHKEPPSPNFWERGVGG
jgi:GT2 family glycosyltransferase